MLVRYGRCDQSHHNHHLRASELDGTLWIIKSIPSRKLNGNQIPNIWLRTWIPKPLPYPVSADINILLCDVSGPHLAFTFTSLSISSVVLLQMLLFIIVWSMKKCSFDQNPLKKIWSLVWLYGTMLDFFILSLSISSHQLCNTVCWKTMAIILIETML